MTTRPFDDAIEYLTGAEAAKSIIAYLTKVLHGPDKLLVDALGVALRELVTTMPFERALVTTTPFAPEEYLNSPEAIAAYLVGAMQTGDEKFISDAVHAVARARWIDNHHRLIPELTDGWKYASLHENQNRSWSAIIHLTQIDHPYAEEHRWGRGDTINAACLDAIGKI